jgi:hypothetical protein
VRRGDREFRGEAIAEMTDAEIDRLLDQRLSDEFVDRLCIEALQRLRTAKPTEQQEDRPHRKKSQRWPWNMI